MIGEGDSPDTEYAVGESLLARAPDGTPCYRSAYHGLASQLGVDVFYVQQAAAKDELRSLFPATITGVQALRRIWEREPLPRPVLPVL